MAARGLVNGRGPRRRRGRDRTFRSVVSDTDTPKSFLERCTLSAEGTVPIVSLFLIEEAFDALFGSLLKFFVVDANL